ncbi:MAG: cytochrome c3 family protein, partial [Proteobacteria bacterium]|nr:cytochrome c3 family protein [Pseudomonadota bacterium]
IEATEAAKDQIDCVLCHGKTYDGGGEGGQRVVLTDNQSRMYWSHASLADAKTVGDNVTAQACKRCHINTGGKVFSPDGKLVKAFKYGTDYVAEPYELTYDNGQGVQETATIDADVHAKAGMRCATCHYIEDHKFKYGRHNVSWGRDEVPDTLDCSDCHDGSRPHDNSTNPNKAALNMHTAYLACQTCHIRHAGGLMRRDLRQPYRVNDEAAFYEFKDTVKYGVAPEYRWFNGKSGGWEAVLEGPCPIGPKGSLKGYADGDGSKITPFKRYEAVVWFDLFVLQPVPYVLKYFLVDGDLETAANEGMEASGWLRGNKEKYNFALRRALGIVFPFPMVCELKVDHGIQTGANALGYDEQGCNTCHSSESKFWKFLGYKRSELRELQQPR